MSRYAYDKDNKELTPIAGMSIIDDALSSSSKNAVENRVITNALSEKETAPTVLTQTLTAGSTSVTFSDAAITTDSILDVYANVYGIAPSAITVSTGQAVLTFKAQSNDVSVKLFIR